jgi:hypothetical protein
VLGGLANVEESLVVLERIEEPPGKTAWAHRSGPRQPTGDVCFVRIRPIGETSCRNIPPFLCA